MVDLSKTIAPKSNQLNADDLIAGPMTVTVRSVKLSDGAEQPILLEHDKGQPYYPCKSMRRVLVQLWGPDGAKYAGRSMTLYRDASVKWGGVPVGGIRISHMSDISGEKVMSLTESKSNRKPFKVLPLKVGETKSDAPPFDAPAFETLVKSKVAEAIDAGILTAWWDSMTPERKSLAAADQEKSAELRKLVSDKIGELAAGGEV